MLLCSKQKYRSLKESVNDFSVELSGQPINVVQSHKLLGLHLDAHMTCDKHISNLCQRLHSRLFLFNKIKYLLSWDAKVLFFNGLVQPSIDYCCTVWGNCSKQNLKRIHRIMKLFGRSILGVKRPRDISTVDLFRQLNWLPVNERIKYMQCLLVFKCINGLVPGYLSSYFKSLTSTHQYHTRLSASAGLQQITPKTGQGARAFRIQGADLWNALDPHIRNSPSADSFKSRYIKHVSSHIYQNPHFWLDT